jgi:hypothetical protein
MFVPCNMKWEEDYKITSSRLWEANPAEHLPRGMLMFPQVDMVRPHSVHFLFIEFGFVSKKKWVISIDMTPRSWSHFLRMSRGRRASKLMTLTWSERSPWFPCPSSLVSSPSSSIYQGTYYCCCPSIHHLLLNRFWSFRFHIDHSCTYICKRKLCSLL